MFDLNLNFPDIRLSIAGLFRRKVIRSKENTSILFIDDQDMPVVDNLKRAGYKVSKKRDVRNIHDNDVRCSHIIFVDFDGVGTSVSSQYQGAGLIKQIKDEYGSSKFVIFYSARSSVPIEIVMGSYLERADAKIKKDADESEFIKLIHEAFEKI